MRFWIALFALVALIVGCAESVAAATPERGEPVRLRIKVAEFDPRVAEPALPPGLRWAGEPASGYFVVQFDRPLRPALIARLTSAGARPIGYLPDQAYLVQVPEGRLAALRAVPELRWVGPVQPGWKIAPDLGSRTVVDPARREGGRMIVSVDLFPGEPISAAIAHAAQIGAELLGTHEFSTVRRLVLRASREEVDRLAALTAVAWIEEAPEPTLRNDTAKWVVQTNVVGSTTIWDRGLHGENQIVGLIDDRIDPNSCYFRDPVDNTPGPGHRKMVAYRSSSGTGASGHGTHVAGSLAGDRFPINGTISGNGEAWAAKISFSNFADIDGYGSQDSNLYEYLAFAHGDGARVHSNSWGDDGTTSYTSLSRDIDLFSWDHEDSLVLFAVTNLSSLRAPENAKNLLAVGATENGTSSAQHCSGGVGPTFDGRRKPEIYAPGCNIQSARDGIDCGTQPLSGTSMACPAVAAAGVLVRQYFEEGWYPGGSPQATRSYSPTAALVKAILLNSAVDMTGVAGYPSALEGWGRLLLENSLYFAGESRHLAVLADIRNAQGLGTGSSVSIPFTVNGSQERLDLALVFTEPAAALFASPVTVNNLDLQLESPSGVVWRGNVFNAGVSTPGGAADPLNNVERISIPSPETGIWFARVIGTAINQSTQGFALVANGQVAEIGTSLLRVDGYLVDDSGPLGNGNDRLDPGETVLVPVDVRNVLTGAVTDPTGRIAASTALLTITDSEADLPDIPGASARRTLAPHFRVTLPPNTACGALIPVSLDLVHDAGASLSAFDLEVGRRELRRDATGLPLTIPASGTAQSALAIGEAITIGDVNVFVQLQHTNISELTLILTSPQGTAVTLYDGTAGGANLLATFDRQRAVDGPGSMNDFNGQPAQGNWTLTVKDTVAGSTPTGALVGWSLLLDPPGGPLCSPFTCGGQGIPGNVGATLRLAKNGADLAFSWGPATGATAYRVWRSTSPQFTAPLIVAQGASTAQVEAGAATAGGSGLVFYQIHAINSCEWQGP